MIPTAQRTKAFFGSVVVAGLLLLSGYFIPSTANAGDAVLPSTVLLSASANESPSGILLQWSADPNAQKYDIYRKAKNADSWGSIIGTISGPTPLTYLDTSAGPGSVFEYRVVKTINGGGTDEAYVLAGNKAPLVDSRGRVVLVVDNTYASDLSFELDRLKDDLEGDGWTVVRLDVSRADTPSLVRNLIAQKYLEDPAVTSHVFLFGHVPVPYSGFAASDGHDDHNGAWPADVFYGDIDGTWTDTQSSASRCPVELVCPTIPTRTANFPGDGKFDQNTIPSKVELAVGRVDFANMTAFLPKNEKDLLRQYLNKDHLFRVGGMSTVGVGYTSDLFAFLHEQDTWKDFVAFFGQNGFFSSSSLGDGNGNLWTRFAGPGYPAGIYNGIATNDIVASGKSPGIFNQMFGSYFGDWDFSDNLMRSFIADQAYGLSSAWVGFYNWKFYRMGLGETLGDSTRLSQNIDPAQSYAPLYKWTASGTKRASAAALMGDPTLHLHTVLPPTSIVLSSGGVNSVNVSWTASPDVGIVGYHVYRALGNGAFARLTTSPITATTFTDPSVSSGLSRYMVRAVRLQSSGSGSYYNASQGALAKANLTNTGGNVTVAVVPPASGGCALGACPTSGPTRQVTAVSILPATPATITTRQGEIFTVTYHYRGGPTEKNWNQFSFLVNADNSLVIGSNDMGYPNLTFSQYPSTWSGGDRSETFTFKTPTNTLPPGEYRLMTGFYDGPDRFSLTNLTNLPAGTGPTTLAYEVAKVTVLAGVDRMPPVRTRVTPPLPPSSFTELPAGTTSTFISLDTDESATCKYATTYTNPSGTPYSAMTSTLTASNGGKTHSATLTGLTNGSYRSYYVRCSDTAGNANSTDLLFNFHVASAPANGAESFTISATTNSPVTVPRGSPAYVSIAVQKTSTGAGKPVTFTMGSTMPAGTTYSFMNAPCTPSPSCTATLRIDTTSATPLFNNAGLTVLMYDAGTPLTSVTFSFSVTDPAAQTTQTPVEATASPAPTSEEVNPTPVDTNGYSTPGSTFAIPTALAGWAWSSTVGWLSFSSNNEAAPSGEYGVNRDIYGNLTGYVWAANIGWIKFGGLATDSMPSSTVAPGTVRQNARVDASTGRLSGWVRACGAASSPSTCSDAAGTTYTATNPDPRGGWGGWVSLSGITASGNYGVQLNSDSRYAGYAWGSDVLGWVQFDVPVPSNPDPELPDIAGSCISPTGAITGQVATWSATASGGTGTFTYSWSGSDSLASSGTSAPKVYSVAGIKFASVAISSGGRTLVVPCTNISVGTPPLPPLEVVVVASPPSARVGEPITWSAVPEGGDGSYEYSWSGSQSLAGFTPSATISYQTAGTMTATVEVISGGLLKTVSAQAVIQPAIVPPPPPEPPAPITATCTVPTNPIALQISTWSVSASGGDSTYTYSWTGTDGLNGGGTETSINYPTAGTKGATVTIFSGEQSLVKTCPDISVAPAPVTPPALNVDIVANPSTAYVGEPITWAAVPQGGDGTYSYSWSGSQSLAGFTQSATVAYSSAGQKSASVQVVSAGQTITVSSTANILTPPTPPPPVPAITASCTAPVGAQVDEIATWSTNPSGGDGTYTYSWTGSDGLNGGSRTAPIVYSTPGTKTASVTIYSGNQTLSVTCPNATVTAPPPPELQAAVTGSPATAYVNDAITWTVTVSGGTGTYAYSWSSDVSGTADRTTTSYASAGTKTGTMTVTSGAQQKTMSATVTILPVGGGGGTTYTPPPGGGASCIGVCETSSILGLTCNPPTKSTSPDGWTWTADITGSFKGNQPFRFNWTPSGASTVTHTGVSTPTDSFKIDGAMVGQFPTVSVADSSVAVNSSQLISCPAVPSEMVASDLEFGAVSIANTSAAAPSSPSVYKSSITTQKGRAAALRYSISGGNADDFYFISQSGTGGTSDVLSQQLYSTAISGNTIKVGPFNTEGTYRYALKVFSKGVSRATGTPKAVSEITVTVRTNPDLDEF